MEVKGDKGDKGDKGEIEMTAKDLIHDVHNYYGVRVDIFKAVEYLEVAEHPTPSEFLQWLEKK